MKRFENHFLSDLLSNVTQYNIIKIYSRIGICIEFVFFFFKEKIIKRIRTSFATGGKPFAVYFFFLFGNRRKYNIILLVRLLWGVHSDVTLQNKKQSNKYKRRRPVGKKCLRVVLTRFLLNIPIRFTCATVIKMRFVFFLHYPCVVDGRHTPI